MKDFIGEKEVDLPNLERLFLDAQYEASIDSDGRFMVLAETALVAVDVLAENNQRFIRFTSMYKLKDGVGVEDKLAFSNRLNSEIAFSRFSTLGAGHVILNMEYFLPFWGGIAAYHIVAAFRMFVYVYTSVPSVADMDKLIECGSYPLVTVSPHLSQRSH